MSSGPLISPLVEWLAGRVTDELAAIRSDRYPVAPDAAEYPLIDVDRTVEARYVGHDLRPFAGGCRRLDLTVEVRIAYRYATEPTALGGPDGEADTSTARLRAADDAVFLRERLLDAATYGAASNGAVVVMMTPGAHTIDDPGTGALLGVLPVALVASYTPADVTAGAALA